MPALFSVATAVMVAVEVWNPFAGLFLPPVGRPPLPEGCRVGVELALASHLSYSSGPWGELGVDAEEARVGLRLSQAGPAGEFSVYLPLRLFYSGVLDGPLNLYHGVVGEPKVNPPGTPRTLVFYRLNTGMKRRIDQPVFGVGDPVLGWGLVGPEGSWGRVSLALPVGDPAAFMGAGSARLALAAGVDRYWGGLAVQAVWPLAPPPALEGLEPRPTLGARVWAQLPFGLDGRVEVQVQSSPLGVGDAFAGTTVALKVVLYGFTFAEDATPALPDVVLGKSFEWNC